MRKLITLCLILFTYVSYAQIGITKYLTITSPRDFSGRTLKANDSIMFMSGGGTPTNLGKVGFIPASKLSSPFYTSGGYTRLLEDADSLIIGDYAFKSGNDYKMQVLPGNNTNGLYVRTTNYKAGIYVTSTTGAGIESTSGSALYTSKFTNTSSTAGSKALIGRSTLSTGYGIYSDGNFGINSSFVTPTTTSTLLGLSGDKVVSLPLGASGKVLSSTGTALSWIDQTNYWQITTQGMYNYFSPTNVLPAYFGTGGGYADVQLNVENNTASLSAIRAANSSTSGWALSVDGKFKLNTISTDTHLTTVFGLGATSGTNVVTKLTPGTDGQVLTMNNIGQAYWSTLPSTTSMWSTSGNYLYPTEYTTKKVGIGTSTPANLLDVEGGIAVGSTYSGTITAPSNGAIIEGNVGIGMNNPSAPLDVTGNVQITYNGTTANTLQVIQNNASNTSSVINASNFSNSVLSATIAGSSSAGIGVQGVGAIKGIEGTSLNGVGGYFNSTNGISLQSNGITKTKSLVYNSINTYSTSSLDPIVYADFKTSNLCKATIGYNSTINFYTPPVSPTTLKLILKHDATSDTYAFIWTTSSGNIYWENNTEIADFPVANAVIILDIFFDGTDYYITYTAGY